LGARKRGVLDEWLPVGSKTANSGGIKERKMKGSRKKNALGCSGFCGRDVERRGEKGFRWPKERKR